MWLGYWLFVKIKRGEGLEMIFRIFSLIIGRIVLFIIGKRKGEIYLGWGSVIFVLGLLSV